MYKIGICDDEKIYINEIREYFRQYAKENALGDYEIFEFTAGEEISKELGLDILFLDIQMKGIDGLQVKEKLQQENANTEIIFVSSYTENMPEAFGKNVMGFLEKPVDYKVFCKRVAGAIVSCRKKKRYITYDECGVIRKINIEDIVYIKSDGRYTDIHIQNERNILLSSKSMRYYKAELGKGFEMSERSYLVNLKYVTEVETDVILENGMHIPMSRRKAQKFSEMFRKSIWGEE